MAPLMYFSRRKVLPLYLLLILFSSFLLCVFSAPQLQNKQFLKRRRLLDSSPKEEHPNKIKPNLSSKNQTKFTKTSNSTQTAPILHYKTELKKLNSTSKLKKLNNNSSSKTYSSTKNSSDLLNISSSKNKTAKSISKQTEFKNETLEPNKNQKTEKKITKQEKLKKQSGDVQQHSWIEEDDGDDFVSDFKDLPSKFQQTLIPDLEKFSTTSKVYITKANNQITKGFKPFVGNKYASTIASIVSFASILIPFILVSLIFNQIKAYFSLQKLLIFIQIYLSIYFSILCLSSLLTGLDPLRFFYATSQASYVCLQIFQTIGYVLFLLLLLMYLILVFSTECGLVPKMLGLAQTFVGFSVGLHYYMVVFHRMIMHQPPKTNWKVHGMYATCFFMVCLFASDEKRKKAYLVDGGEEGKKS